MPVPHGAAVAFGLITPISKKKADSAKSLTAKNTILNRSVSTTGQKKLEHIERENQPDSNATPVFLPVQFEQTTQGLRDILQFVHVERAATDIALPVNLTGEQMKSWLQAIHALHV